MICLTCTIFFNVFCCHYRCHVYGGLENSLVVDTVLRVMDVMAFLGGFQLYCEMLGSGGDGKPIWERCVL